MNSDVLIQASLLVSPRSLRRIRAAGALITFIAFAVCLAGLLRAGRELGRPFGGFAWMRGYADRYYVLAFTPYHWPGLQAGLEAGDVIVTADAMPPDRLPEAFAAGSGAQVAYTIQRGSQRLELLAPVVPLDRRMLFEIFGVYVLAGISSVAAAHVLLRRTRELPLALIALFLLVTGALELILVYGPRFGAAYEPPVVVNVIWSYCYPLAGALLWHLALVFPRRRALLLRRPMLPLALYLAAALSGSLYFAAIYPLNLLRRFEPWLYPAIVLIAASGMVASVVSGVTAYLGRRGVAGDTPQRKVRHIAAAWLISVGLDLYIVLGFNFNASWLPDVNSLLLPIAMIYPLLLVYAVRNLQLIDRLEQEVAVAEGMANELRELREHRERTLGEVADALHDTVVSNVRGLQFWLAALQMRGAAEARDLHFLGAALDDIYHTTRRIMEGAKPVDFAADGLVAPLRQSLEHLRQTSPGLHVTLSAEGFDESFPPQIKEEVYWMIQSAIANSRDHAQARGLDITLRRDAGTLCVRVRDDGAGFDTRLPVSRAAEAEGRLRPAAAHAALPAGGRRHLGLRNMRARAARLGAELAIESGPAGTEVKIDVPISGTAA